MDSLDFRLVNEFQRGFPLDSEPFAELAWRLCIDEETVLAALRRLQACGVVSRVGAVLAPRRIGASTLAAVAVPPPQLVELARKVSARPEVNHNYEREHHYNLWFVVTAPDQAHLDGALADIGRELGYPVLSLPLEYEFYIDLGFDLAGVCKSPYAARRIDGAVLRTLTFDEERLLGVLQYGLELVSRPFARLAEQAGLDESTVIAMIKAWRGEGLIKRFGIIVRHHELGFVSNAMVVWDLPDHEAERIGRLFAAEPEVTLCYKRRRHLPQWPYNLYCMIHGRSRTEVEAAVVRLRDRLGLEAVRYEVLFSRRRFKQRGALYIPQVEAAHG